MSDLRDLYQEVILDHCRKPRNFGRMEGADQSAEGFNPLCGDRVTVFLKMKNGTVEDVRFQGTGCAISTASASMMTEALKGRTRADAEALFEKFHDLVTHEPNSPAGATGLGKLAVFSGVREFPMRVKCATLPWHTLRAALDKNPGVISTEE
jgi:nitrogen fixation NifU-like protein